MIVLSTCTLKGKIKKEEEKDYTDVVHPVDREDYEFEQRLNSFYESRPIKNYTVCTRIHIFHHNYIPKGLVVILKFF